MEKKVQNSSENPAQGYNEQYRYDERNRLVQKQLWENGSATPADTTTYTYDAQGSLLSEQSSDLCRKYLYNDFHQCICTEVIRGREEEAERILQENCYDGDGLRFSLIENGKRTDFITNGWDNLAELDETGQVTKRIIRGMGIVASEDVEDNVIDASAAFTGTAYHYYHGNERMDVEFITDEAGQVVNGYTYDAFGTIVTSSEKLQNRYTYNGEAFDKTTEQYYLRKRFYNPKLSRFIQEDEYRGDGLNLYAFCANNPVMYVDPSGYAVTKCGTGGSEDDSNGERYGVQDSDIEAYRRELGDPINAEGNPLNTVAVGKTNIPELQDKVFTGASPDVRKAAGLDDLDTAYPDRSIKSPYENAAFIKHAEEGVMAEFEQAIKDAGLDPKTVKGDLYMMQSFGNGVCNNCAAGLLKQSPSGRKGIFKQFMEMYPNVNVHLSTYSKAIPGRGQGLLSFDIVDGTVTNVVKK